MKISRELLNEVGMYTDVEYEDEQDQVGVEEIIKDLLKEIEKLHDFIQEKEDEEEDQKDYTCAYDLDNEFMYAQRLWGELWRV